MASSRLPGLDLLRAVAIVWVMAFHTFWLGGVVDQGIVSRSGWMGVDLFFALSGFLIGTQVLRPLSQGGGLAFGDFYLRRAFRILPAFWVVLACYALWPTLREVPGIRPAWEYLSFTMNLLPAPAAQAAFSHVWSLCVEEHFYLLFPLFAWTLARRGSVAMTMSIAACLVLGGIALRGWLWMHRLQPVMLDGGAAGPVYLRYLYDPTWARLDELLDGVLLAAFCCYRERGWAWLQAHANAVSALGLGIVGICVVWFDGRRMDWPPNVFGYPLLALGLTLLVAAGASARGVLGRLAVPGAGWVARVSYSLYLTHKAVYMLVHRHLGAWVEGHGLLTLLAYALAVLAVGAALHYGVERPFLRLRRRVLARLHGRAGALVRPARRCVASGE